MPPNDTRYAIVNKPRKNIVDVESRWSMIRHTNAMKYVIKRTTAPIQDETYAKE